MILPGTRIVMAVCTALRMMLSRANIQWGLMLWFRSTLFTYRNEYFDGQKLLYIHAVYISDYWHIFIFHIYSINLLIHVWFTKPFILKTQVKMMYTPPLLSIRFLKNCSFFIVFSAAITKYWMKSTILSVSVLISVLVKSCTTNHTMNLPYISLLPLL